MNLIFEQSTGSVVRTELEGEKPQQRLSLVAQPPTELLENERAYYLARLRANPMSPATPLPKSQTAAGIGTGATCPGLTAQPKKGKSPS